MSSVHGFGSGSESFPSPISSGGQMWPINITAVVLMPVYFPAARCP